jgi:hypothetical protein
MHGFSATHPLHHKIARTIYVYSTGICRPYPATSSISYVHAVLKCFVCFCSPLRTHHCCCKVAVEGSRVRAYCRPWSSPWRRGCRRARARRPRTCSRGPCTTAVCMHMRGQRGWPTRQRSRRERWASNLGAYVGGRGWQLGVCIQVGLLDDGRRYPSTPTKTAPWA